MMTQATETPRRSLSGFASRFGQAAGEDGERAVGVLPLELEVEVALVVAGVDGQPCRDSTSITLFATARMKCSSCEMKQSVPW